MTKSKVPWLGLFSHIFCLYPPKYIQLNTDYQYFYKNFLPLKNTACLLLNVFCVFVNLWQRGVNWDVVPHWYPWIKWLKSELCKRGNKRPFGSHEHLLLGEFIENIRTMGAVSPGFLGSCVFISGAIKDHSLKMHWPDDLWSPFQLWNYSIMVTPVILGRWYLSPWSTAKCWLLWGWKQWRCPLHCKLSQLK